MPRFPLVILFYFFFPCLLGVGLSIYSYALFEQPAPPIFWIIVYVGIVLMAGLGGVWWFWYQWWTPYLRFVRHMKQFATRHKTTISKRHQRTFWRIPHAELTHLERYFEEVIDFTTALAQRKFDTELSSALQNSPFASRLQEVRRQLQTQEIEAERQAWAMRGLAEFSDILRNSEHLGLETLTNYFLRQLVKYMHAQQGVVYLLNEQDEQDLHLQLVANYALAKTDFDNKRIELNEGITGECFTKCKFYYIQDIKDDYSPIFSGLGAASPHALLIFPIALHDKTLGVIEMASWHTYEEYQLDFLETICENLAVTIEGFYMQTQTEVLLKETEKINGELLKQEKEMKENALNLEFVQQELSLKLQFIEEETNFLKYILQAIDKTNAMIEMDMDGTILEANEMYLSVMGYTEDEIVGKNERILLSEEEANSERYELMWETLRSGSFISGEYRRIARDGREVWLEGTYNPILDTEGKPNRIMKLAQFTTEDKELEQQLNNKINALGKSLMMVEVNLLGIVKTVNQSFLTHFQIKRSEIRNLPITALLQESKDNLVLFQEMWAQAEQGNNPLDKTFAYQIAGKPTITKANTRINPVKNIFGKIESIIIVLIDVTEVENTRLQLANYTQALVESKQALEIRLQEENNLLHVLWQSAKVVELDKNYKFIRANDRFLTKFKIPASEIPHRYFHELIKNPFPEKILQEMWATVAQKGHHEMMLKYGVDKSTGFWGNTTITTYHDFVTQEIRYIIVIQNITQQIVKEVYLRGEVIELKLKNAMLRHAHLFEDEDNPTWQKLPQMLQNLKEETLEEVIAHNIAPCLRLSNTGKILQVNDLALDVLGYQRTQLVAKKIHELLVFKDEESKAKFFTDLEKNGDALEQWLIINNYQGNGLYANTFIKSKKDAHYLFFVVP